MLKFYIALFGLHLLISATSAANGTADALYFKFHQNDYDIIPEWAEVVSFKKPEIQEFKMKIFKFNRTCPAANVTVGFGIDLGNELEVIIQSYKFASNEYRLFPMRIQLNFCTALNFNLIGLSKVKTCGNFTGCPILKGRTYHACNWTPDQTKFPPYMPVGRYMLEFQGLFRGMEIYVLRGYGEVVRSILKY